MRHVPGLALAALVTATPLTAQLPDSLPPGVTPEAIARGGALFHGRAICSSCHGKDAVGVQGIGPDLRDTTWLHSDGSYEAIVQQILRGVAADRSTSGIMMPPKGGVNLSDDEVRAVAAYVWSRRFPTRN